MSGEIKNGNENPQNNDTAAEPAGDTEYTARKKNQKLKRNIIIVFSSMVVFMAICLILPNIVDLGSLFGQEKNQENDTSSGKNNTIIFHETKEPGFDIFEYEEYLGLDRNIYYADGSGLKESVEESKVPNYGEGFAVVYNVIKAIINGDADTYNDYMGENILKEDEFTQQQLYEIVITKDSQTSNKTDTGKIYNQYTFTVEYMIHENNGTFRTDFGSDEIKKQYFVVTNQSGKYLVDNILAYTNNY